MIVIGLTGASGSGKGTVARIFEGLGVPALDTDAVYHRLTCAPSPCLSALRAAFGDSVLAADGSLNRRALATLVFCGGELQEARNRLLQSITHPFVLDECRAWLATQRRAGRMAAIIDAPLLYESGFDRECDKIIVVTAKRETRVARIVARDGLTAEAAEARIAAQGSEEFYLSRADYVIHNDADEAALLPQITQIYKVMERMFVSKTV